MRWCIGSWISPTQANKLLTKPKFSNTYHTYLKKVLNLPQIYIFALKLSLSIGYSAYFAVLKSLVEVIPLFGKGGLRGI